MKNITRFIVFALALFWLGGERSAAAQELEMTGVTDLSSVGIGWGLGVGIGERGRAVLVGSLGFQGNDWRERSLLTVGLEYEYRLEEFAEGRLIPFFRGGLRYVYGESEERNEQFGFIETIHTYQVRDGVFGALLAGVAYFPTAHFGLRASVGAGFGVYRTRDSWAVSLPGAA